MHAKQAKGAKAAEPAARAARGGGEVKAASLTRLPRWALGHGGAGLSAPAGTSLPVQPKLTVNQPGDVYEQEADQVAAQVMRMPDQAMRAPAPLVQRACACGGTAGPDGECEACKAQRVQRQVADEEQLQRQVVEEDEEAKLVQAKPLAPRISSLVQRSETGDATTAPPLVNTVIRGSGQHLDAGTRAFMETRFGQDFAGVRIHTSGQAAESARSIQAKAYTVGQNIVFGAGFYTPGTASGRQLLAHELTHVVQQTGGVQAKRQPGPSYMHIQREERKDYVGNWAHTHIENKLEQANDNLITEAPIPGGTRNAKGLNLVGFADLYKSQGNLVSGVQGYYQAEERIFEEAKRTLSYKNMPTESKTKGSRWAAISPKAKVKYGPRLTGTGQKRTWEVTNNFPEWFSVGEIKPLFALEFKSKDAIGLGIAQLGNYEQGFQEFVERAHKDSGVTRASTSGGRLAGLRIPDEISYKEFAKEHKKDGKEAILKKDTKERVWVYELGNGLYVYFLLPHPYTSTHYPRELDKQLQELDPILKELRQKHRRIKGVCCKADPGAPSRPAIARPRLVARQLVQRACKPLAAAKGDEWDRRAQTWEQKRCTWDEGATGQTDGAQQFLKEKAAGPAKRLEIDQKLNLTPDSPEEEKRQKGLKRVQFWSGASGRLFGVLRFKFGRAFDKLSAFFDKVKEKFTRVHKKSDKLNDKGGIFEGWKKRATRIIIRLAVDIFKQTLVQGFAMFTACVNGIIDNIVNKFVDDASDELHKELEPVLGQVEDFRRTLDEKYSKEAELLSRFVDDIESFKEWAGILGNVVTAIRIGVQIISCGTPPGLGCLWGLVAQLGISAALDLVTRTDYFEGQIARPAAHALMDTIVGDAFMNLIAASIKAAKLEPYAQGVKDCTAPPKRTGGGTGTGLAFDPNDPNVVKVRQEWERQYHDTMIKDLQKQLRKGGKPATEQDIADLVKQIQDSGKTLDELKAILEGAQEGKSKKIAVETVSAELTGTATAPDTAEGETGEGDQAGEGGEAGKAVPTLDAGAAPEGGGTSPANDLSAQVAVQSGHTAHPDNPPITVTVWIYRSGEAVLQVTNVSVIVKKRTFVPEGSNEQTATHLKVHYQLLKSVVLAPHLDAILTGGETKTIYGYLKWK